MRLQWVGRWPYAPAQMRSVLVYAPRSEEPANPPVPAGAPDPAAAPPGERMITTRELLAGAQRIWIEHAAQRYLLQVTRSGKLILTK